MMKKRQISLAAGSWAWYAYGIAHLHEHIHWSSYVHPCLHEMAEKNTMSAGTCAAETASVCLPIL